ncbi:MAG TPA: PqqD family protein [Myxococcota bacterium]|nr:PqqD family protein [Myxococcota bacterium]
MTGRAPLRHATVTDRELPDGERVLLTPDGSGVLVLNPLGSVIWTLCDGAHDVEGMARIIGERFPEVAPEQIARDVNAVLKQLAEAKLLDDVS